MPATRALHTRPKTKSSPFRMQMPDDEREQLELTVARLQRRRLQGLSNVTKEPSAAKVVRVALRQLLGSTTTEQLEDLLETTEL